MHPPPDRAYLPQSPRTGQVGPACALPASPHSYIIRGPRGSALGYAGCPSRDSPRPALHPPCRGPDTPAQGPPPALPPPPAPRPSGQPQAAAVQPRQLTAISTFQQAREESTPQALTRECLEGRGAGYAGTPCLRRLRVQAAPGSAQHKGTHKVAERLWEPGVTVTRRVCEGPAKIVGWLQDPRGVAGDPRARSGQSSPSQACGCQQLRWRLLPRAEPSACANTCLEGYLPSDESFKCSL